jgi:hypothetical protein
LQESTVEVGPGASNSSETTKTKPGSDTTETESSGLCCWFADSRVRD